MFSNTLDAALYDQAIRDELRAEQEAEAEDRFKRRKALEDDAVKGASAYTKAGLPPFFPPPKRFGELGYQYLDGEWWMSLVTDDGFEPCWSPMHIRKTGAVYKDRIGEPYALIVELLAPDLTTKAVELDADDITSPRAMGAIKKLRAAGMRFAQRGTQLFADVLMQTQPPGEAVYDRPGFRGSGFLLPTGESLLSQQPMSLSDRARLKTTSQAGTFDAFRAASYVIFLGTNRTSKFGWLSGLVGTLVDAMKGESAVYMLEGPSSTGKSSAQMLGASHWANPQLNAGLFISAKMTMNALEPTFEMATGTYIGLDENRHFTASESENLAFMLQQGAGKARANRNGDAQRVRKFFTACTLSAEVGVTQRLAQEGKTMAGGFTVRVMTIFTEGQPPPTADDIAAFRSIVGAGAGSEANYGWGGPAFVHALADQGYLEDPTRLYAEVQKEMEALVPAISGGDVSMARRSARNAALLKVAGLVCQKARLLPAEFDVDAFVRELWDEFRSSDAAPNDPIEKAIQTLCSTLIAREGIDVVKVDDRYYKEPVAYTSILPTSHEERGQEVFVIRPGKLGELSGNSASERDLRKALDRAGYVVRNPRKDKSVIQWSSFPKLAKSEYLVLRGHKVRAVD